MNVSQFIKVNKKSAWPQFKPNIGQTTTQFSFESQQIYSPAKHNLQTHRQRTSHVLTQMVSYYVISNYAVVRETLLVYNVFFSQE